MAAYPEFTLELPGLLWRFKKYKFICAPGQVILCMNPRRHLHICAQAPSHAIVAQEESSFQKLVSRTETLIEPRYLLWDLQGSARSTTPSTRPATWPRWQIQRRWGGVIQFEQAWKFVHPEPRPSTPVPALCFPQLHMKVAEATVPAQDTT